MDKEFICSLYHHDCECCPYEVDQIDEEGRIVLDCSYERETKEQIVEWCEVPKEE